MKIPTYQKNRTVGRIFWEKLLCNICEIFVKLLVCTDTLLPASFSDVLSKIICVPLIIIGYFRHFLQCPKVANIRQPDSRIGKF